MFVSCFCFCLSSVLPLLLSVLSHSPQLPALHSLITISACDQSSILNKLYSQSLPGCCCTWFVHVRLIWPLICSLLLASFFPLALLFFCLPLPGCFLSLPGSPVSHSASLPQSESRCCHFLPLPAITSTKYYLHNKDSCSLPLIFCLLLGP